MSTNASGDSVESCNVQLATAPTLTRKDFQSGSEVKWCPGCGDHGILMQVQNLLPKLGVPKEDIVFVSGIGCSSRFPYYLSTYGFHGIHGRAPAIAMGVACARPDLTVFVVTGDGDGLSIGTNHLIHAIRRNLNLKILLLNNQIYGLTKGQYSPTSEYGKKTKSSPYGTIEQPIHPLELALAAEATFVARAMIANPTHFAKVLEAAAQHKGTAFIEILQNCVVFNEGVLDDLGERSEREDHVVYIEDGKPLIFGKDRDKGIMMRGLQPTIVNLGEGGAREEDLLVHDSRIPSRAPAQILAGLAPPEYPKAFGVFRRVQKPTYESLMMDQLKAATAQNGKGELSKLLTSGTTWFVD